MITVYFIKMLNKLKLLPYFNFIISKNINTILFQIPIIDTIGFENLNHKINWLDSLIQEFVTTEKTFIDVGANIGQTILRLKSNLPDAVYLGFEANAGCVYYCQKLIEINQLKNTKIYNIALSSGVSRGELAKSSNSSSSASITNIRPLEYYGHIEYVLTVDFHRLFLNEPIGFVKVDAEGAELDILKGMKDSILTYHPLIACEVLDSWGPKFINMLQQRATFLSDMLMEWNYNIIQLHTNENGIKFFEKIDSIKIVQWTLNSYFFNDYLFYPIEKEEYVVKGLRKICSRI